MEQTYVIRYYREHVYIVPMDSVRDFDAAHAYGTGTRMMSLADIVIDAHTKEVTKARHF